MCRTGSTTAYSFINNSFLSRGDSSIVECETFNREDVGSNPGSVLQKYLSAIRSAIA